MPSTSRIGRGLAVVAALGLAAAAAQAHVQWSIGIDAPLAPGVALGTVVSNGPLYAAPVYVQPAPVVYAPAPVVYAPAPVYVAPRPVYFARPVPYVVRERGWHRHPHRFERDGWR
ncbi:MAG TPA: hypothetical protein VF291_02110 [Burkholderiaceae bacterium]